MTNQQLLRKVKQPIRLFLQSYYTDQDLAMAYAHAKEGKLAFMSCCCLIGIPTADHALKGWALAGAAPHYWRAKELPGAILAEDAFGCLGSVDFRNVDVSRRKRLIPMLRAEMRRRERLRQEQEQQEQTSNLVVA